MAAAEPDNFFKEKRTTSEIKDKILPAYFQAWYEIQVKEPGSQPPKPLIFIDVNAGEGYAGGEEPAAPIIILNQIYQNSLSETGAEQQVKTFFINPTEATATKLQNNLLQLPFYPNLNPVPEALTEAALQDRIASSGLNQEPALMYLDPVRSTLTRQMLAQALSKTKTDLFLIFNYNKLRQALFSEKNSDWESSFWGSQLSKIKNNSRTESSAKKRESFFIQTFEAIFREAGFYSFKFDIMAPGKNPASQYLLLLTKSLPGYLGLKEIMQVYSEYQEDGVPLFEVTNKPQAPLLPGFFQYLSTYSMENLVAELARSRSRFHYKTLQAIYEEHSVGTNYTKANYKEALEKLRDQGLLYPVNAQNKKINTLKDTSIIFYNLHSAKKH